MEVRQVTTPALGANFVQDADEYEQSSKAVSNDIWIKGFRGGETKIRALLEPDKFKTYLEHYAANFGYFPCSRLKDCVGCTSGSEKVRQRNRRWATNALDANGRQQVYKMGTKLKKAFERRITKAGTVLDRDYLVVRTGEKFNEIDYNLEPEDAYPIEYTEPLFDIPALLGAKYAEAAAAFTGQVVDTSDVAQTIHDESLTTKKKVDPWEAAFSEEQPKQSGGFTAAEIDRETAAKWEEPLSAPPEITLGDSEMPAPVDFNSMSVTQLRDWLTANKVEYPPNEARSRLIKRAVEAAS
jgi:hypothetical protein